MKKGNKILNVTLKFMLFSMLCVLTIFILATMLWIVITPYTFNQFFLVLSLILKKAGSYSTLLVGIVITVFIQIYTKEKDLETEERIKVGEIGYYTLAFPRFDDSYQEKFDGYKIVMEITKEQDYGFNPSMKSRQQHPFMTKFLISKSKSTNLKNVMAFSDKYFEANKEKILNNYFDFCNRVEYSTPLYCSTKPTAEEKQEHSKDINRYFWLVLTKTGADKETKNFWLSAITEEGILMFIKVKADIEYVNDGISIRLIQQTAYYKYKSELKPLYR